MCDETKKQACACDEMTREACTCALGEGLGTKKFHGVKIADTGRHGPIPFSATVPTSPQPRTAPPFLARTTHHHRGDQLNSRKPHRSDCCCCTLKTTTVLGNPIATTTAVLSKQPRHSNDIPAHENQHALKNHLLKLSYVRLQHDRHRPLCIYRTYRRQFRLTSMNPVGSPVSCTSCAPLSTLSSPIGAMSVSNSSRVFRRRRKEQTERTETKRTHAMRIIQREQVEHPRRC